MKIYFTPENDRAISHTLNVEPLGISEPELIDNGSLWIKQVWVHDPVTNEEKLVVNVMLPWVKGRNPTLKLGGRLGKYTPERYRKIESAKTARGTRYSRKGAVLSQETKDKIRQSLKRTRAAAQ